jgi:predicted nuclease of predicted toxin-antitoxin system
MTLLFDENLSPNLPNRLSDLFPNSLHVRDVGMKATIDPIVWDYAKDNDLMIVSKDADMHDLSLNLVDLETRSFSLEKSPVFNLDGV